MSAAKQSTIEESGIKNSNVVFLDPFFDKLMEDKEKNNREIKTNLKNNKRKSKTSRKRKINMEMMRTRTTEGRGIKREPEGEGT